MKQYDSYKESGVEWIGKVPSHWEIMPLKFTGTFGNGLTYSPKDVVDNGILVLRSSNIQNSSLSFEDNVYVSNVSKVLLVQKGDVIICSRNGSGALVGKSAFIDKDINATFGAFMMRYIPKINKKYGFYLFQTAIGRYKGYFATTTINQLTKSTIGEMKVPLANTEEQTAIVDFLDNKCSEIDKVISAQQKRIALLQELKQSVITHVVTKGLNPNVEMKDSGVEWIGKVPKHWEICKLKHVSSLYGRIGFRGYNQTDLVSEGEGAITLSPSNMQNGTMDYNKCSFLSWKKYYESPEIMIKDGDILFVKTGSTYGKTSLVNKLPMEATINPQIVVFKDIKVNNHFLYYLLTNDIVQMQVSLTVGGSTIPTLSQDNILNYVIPIAPKNEQDEIANYLDKKCKSIDSSISKAQHQVELLQEYKQSLITEVVTGKRKVS